jgi:PAS domain S-box-containing protein
MRNKGPQEGGREGGPAPGGPQTNLRGRAEKSLKKRGSPEKRPLSPGEELRAIHELQVHQIELEMQNEELKEARRIAEEAQEKYRALFDFAPVGYLSLGKAGMILELNLTGSLLIGRPRAHIVERRLQSFLTRESIPVFNAFSTKVLASVDKQTCEVGILSNGNEVRFVRIEGIASHGGYGAARIQAAMIDITEQKKAGEALRESEARFRALAEAMPQIVWSADALGAFDYYNPQALAYGGIGPDRVRGWSWESLIHPDDLLATLAAWQQALRTGKSNVMEQRLRRADGEYRWHLSRGVPIRDEQGAVVRWIGTSTDIHDLKLASESFLRSSEWLGIAQRAAHAGFWYWDIPTGKLTWSAELYRLFGLSPTVTASFDAWLGIIHEEDREPAMAKITRSIEAKKALENEFRIVRPDGEVRWIGAWGDTRDDEAGKPLRMSGICIDISERKLAEERITHLASFPELNPNPVIELRFSGEVVYANPAVMKILGNLGLGNDPAAFLPEGFQGMLPRVLEGDVEEEVMVGDRVFLETITLNPMTGTTRIYARDITDRKRTEEAMQETSEYLENLINYANAPIIVWEPGFRITRFNEAFERLTGRTAEEVVGEDLSILFPPGTAAGSMDYIRRAMAGERWEVVEIPILHRDGSVRTVLWNSATLYEPDGVTVSSTIAQGQDITDRKVMELEVARKAAELAEVNVELSAEIGHRKKAEEEARRALSILNAALESTADAMLVVDRSGRTTSYNQNFTTMWNIPDPVLHTLDTRAAGDFVSAQLRDPDAFLARLQEISDRPSRESYDMLELLDGRIIERFSKPQKVGNAIVGRVYSFRDVTDRKRTELEIIRSLEEKEVLLREIHHRVKNNLQLTTSLLDMTRMRTTDPGTGSILTDVMMKIQTMAQIHTRLYESRQFDRINMDGQIRDQIRALSSIYSKEDLEITVEINSSALSLPLDQAIPCALALNEIFSNAYKHAFRGRRSGTVKYSAGVEGGRIRFTISDDGIGLPRGFDLGKASTLGLKLVRTLVEKQLKGRLSMKRLKRGTEVIMEIPVKSEEEHVKSTRG